MSEVPLQGPVIRDRGEGKRDNPALKNLEVQPQTPDPKPSTLNPKP